VTGVRAGQTGKRGSFTGRSFQIGHGGTVDFLPDGKSMVGHDTANLEQELTVDLNPTKSDFMARIGTDLQQGYIYKEPPPSSHLV
jgi:hypothetical protein